MTRVGVVGLGRMGSPIASNLAAAGFEVAVWNRSFAKAEALAESAGVAVFGTPRELAEASDVVISMLSDDAASAAVHRGPDAVFAAVPSPQYVVVMGTHSPRHIRELAAESPVAIVIDAPVSGSTQAAQDAQLLIMAGATEDSIETLGPVFAAIGRKTVCLGWVGAGATMKLVVNMLIHGLNQSVSEALLLAERSGIAIEDSYGVIEDSAAAAPMLGYRKANYLNEEATPVSFALSLARKDVALALELATEAEVDLPQATGNLAWLEAAEKAGFGDRDMAAVLNYLRGTS